MPQEQAMPSGPEKIADAGGGLDRPAVKPRPILFVFLCVVFALWIALLLFLYFKTVYPLRHGSPPPQSATSVGS